MFSAGCCLRLGSSPFLCTYHWSLCEQHHPKNAHYTTCAATYDQTVLIHTKSRRFQLRVEDFYHCRYHFEVVLKYTIKISILYITTWCKGADLQGGPAGSLGITWWIKQWEVPELHLLPASFVRHPLTSQPLPFGETPRQTLSSTVMALTPCCGNVPQVQGSKSSGELPPGY